MTLQLFNTLGRNQAEFVPIQGQTVGLYTCGPTVYHYAHIGNLRSYIFADILRRTLAANGYEVKQVINITDVGHLVGDGDDGQDKLEAGAAREGKTPAEVARFYEAAFKADITKLNIAEPTIWARATEHIAEQIVMVEQLLTNGYAYETEQAVYFNVSKLADYPALSGQALVDKRTAVRDEVVSDSAKHQPADFALWFKLVGRHAKQAQHWPSPWGEGFPGWHIECSAMSTKYLGVPFDLHTGGIDNIAVHHTNERAQNIGVFGREPGEMVRWWLHSEFVVMGGGEKMAKSADNFITLQTLIDRGYDPLAHRYFCLGTHYRKQLLFGWEALDGAAQALKRLQAVMYQPAPPTNPTDQTDPDPVILDRIHEALNDDLNTAQALAALWDLVGSNQPLAVKQATLRASDAALGLGFSELKPVMVPAAVQTLVGQREVARQAKDFATADALRQQILDAGFEVEDTADGYVVKPR